MMSTFPSLQKPTFMFVSGTSFMAPKEGFSFYIWSILQQKDEKLKILKAVHLNVLPLESYQNYPHLTPL